MARLNQMLDLRAPGAIDALLAFHRAHFGDARMEGGEGGGEGQQPKPTTPASGKPDEGKPQTGEADWAAKFEAQQKVNRDLEAKLNELRDGDKARNDAIAKALGIQPEDASDSDKLAAQVADLTGTVGALTKANLVLTIGKGLSDEDQALLASLPDEATMRAVAERLAKQAAEAQESTPGFQPISGQGQGGGKGPTLAQQVATATAEVNKHNPGTPEHKAAQATLMSLKTQQLAALKP